jgi:hypothetical protein
MKSLSRSVGVDAPLTPPFPAPAKSPIERAAVVFAHAGLFEIVVVDAMGETVGIAGADKLGSAVAAKGDMFVNGIAGAELTPRLLISMAPSGIPVCAMPPGTVGDVDAAEVGIDDAAMLLEPEPHIPDVPDVSIIPEDVEPPDDAAIPGIVMVSGVAVPVVTVLTVVAGVPAVAAVAGAAVPAAVPPPSKLVVDPYIPDGKIPTDEHDVPLLVIVPVVGIAIVPVTPVGNGLTPRELISVASSGIPAGPTDALAPIPNGDVAPTEDMAESGSAAGLSTWANAGLAQSNGQAVATIRKSLIGNSPI